jgi:hypothetical protein
MKTKILSLGLFMMMALTLNAQVVTSIVNCCRFVKSYYLIIYLNHFSHEKI